MEKKPPSFLIALLLLIVFPSALYAQSLTATYEEQMQMAQQTPDQIGSVYRAYPGPRNTSYTPAPKGYKPVFISHYGRHGSRFMTSDDHYKSIIKWLSSNELTEQGKALLKDVQCCYAQAEGRGGDLTQLGDEQHRQIARRMLDNFPSLFKGSKTLMVYSSTVRRCMMSMMAFCETLKEANPKLRIERDVCEKNMHIIAADSPKQKSLIKKDNLALRAYQDFKQNTFDGSAFLNRTFVHPDSVRDVFTYMERLYLLAEDMQDCGRPTNLFPYLTPKEIYANWAIKNCEMYLTCSDSPLVDGIPAACSDSLVYYIIQDADQALQEHRGGATLRFGHDTCLLRLLSRMHVSETCPAATDMNSLPQQWQDYNNAPMAGNLQLIFYQDKTGNTLVRILLNENEVHLPITAYANDCYYDWQQVKTLWASSKMGSDPIFDNSNATEYNQL